MTQKPPSGWMEGGLNLLRRGSEGPGWARPGRLWYSTYSFPLRTSQATIPMMLRTAITASQPKRRPASSIATSGDTDSLFLSFICDLTPCRSGATRFRDIANQKRVEDPQGHFLRRHYPDQVRGYSEPKLGLSAEALPNLPGPRRCLHTRRRSFPNQRRLPVSGYGDWRNREKGQTPISHTRPVGLVRPDL